MFRGPTNPKTNFRRVYMRIRVSLLYVVYSSVYIYVHKYSTTRCKSVIYFVDTVYIYI